MLDARRRKPGASCFGKQMKGRGQDEKEPRHGKVVVSNEREKV